MRFLLGLMRCSVFGDSRNEALHNGCKLGPREEKRLRRKMRASRHVFIEGAHISCPMIMSSKRLGRLQFGKLATGLRRVCVNTGFVCHIAMSFGGEFGS